MADEGLRPAPLLDRVRRREPASARTLVEHLYPLAVRIVPVHRPRRMAEEELCQEVFMNVFVNRYRLLKRIPGAAHQAHFEPVEPARPLFFARMVSRWTQNPAVSVDGQAVPANGSTTTGPPPASAASVSSAS